MLEPVISYGNQPMTEPEDPMNAWANDTIRELREAKLLTRKDRTPIRSDVDVELVLGGSYTRVLAVRRKKAGGESREFENRLAQDGYSSFTFSNGNYSLMFVSKSEARIGAICEHLLDMIPEETRPGAGGLRPALVS